MGRLPSESLAPPSELPPLDETVSWRNPSLSRESQRSLPPLSEVIRTAGLHRAHWITRISPLTDIHVSPQPPDHLRPSLAHKETLPLREQDPDSDYVGSKFGGSARPMRPYNPMLLTTSEDRRYPGTMFSRDSPGISKSDRRLPELPGLTPLANHTYEQSREPFYSEPSSYRYAHERTPFSNQHQTAYGPSNLFYEAEMDETGPNFKQRKRRGNLPKATTNFLWKWFRANVDHPYPSEDQKQGLVRRTGLQMNQISNWFINARRRHLARERKRAADERASRSSTSALDDKESPDRNDAVREMRNGTTSEEPGSEDNDEEFNDEVVPPIAPRRPREPDRLDQSDRSTPPVRPNEVRRFSAPDRSNEDHRFTASERWRVQDRFTERRPWQELGAMTRTPEAMTQSVA